MNKKFTKLMAAFALLMFLIPLTGWGQSDYSQTYTSNCTLTPGTQGSTCSVDGNDGVKVGTGSAGGDMSITVPSGAKYLHIHVAAWKGVSNLSLNITPAAYVNETSVALKPNDGISGNSPFTFSGDASSSDYYKVITFTNALTQETTFTFTTSIAKRFVIWGVNSEEDGGGSTAVATTTTINATGITNTDVYTGTAAGSLSASVTETESGEPVSGATVTWSGNNDAVATIDEDGVVTLVSAGTVTFTASYAGVQDEYAASYDTYEMTVTSSAPYVQPTTIEITPNYAFWGQEAQFSGNTYDELSGEQDNVTLEWSRGSGSMYASTTAMRFYKDNTLTFTAPSGYEIKSIKMTFTQTQSDLTFSPEGYDSQTSTWTGSSETVTMSRPSSGSSYYQITKFEITIGAPSTDPSIDADNVEIAYDATGGSIAYTLNNASGNVSAEVTSGDWITLGTITATEVPFTCSANTETTARTAQVTLSFTDATDKVVTITQAAAPVVYTTIPALFAAATSTETPVTITFDNWVISAVKGNNAYLTDNAGNGLIIYQSSHGFNVNDVLSGTASCNLVTYQGSAELTALTAATEGLTVTTGGTVTEQNIAIADLTGVNTGALLHYDGLTYNGTDLVDGNNNSIKPYSTLYSYTFENGKIYNVTGIYLQYNTTKEILPRSAADIEEDLSASIVVANANVQVEGTGGSGLLTVTYTGVNGYYANVQWYDQNGDPASAPLWLNAGLDENYDLTYMVGPNDGEARSAYLKIYVETEGVYSNLVTITQAEYVPDYAFLPFQYTDEDVLTGLNNMPNGLTQSGLGTYSGSTPRLKFDTKDDELVLKLNGTPKAITFDIKGNSFSGGTFIVQLSEDGSTYEDLATYTELGGTTQTHTFLNTNDNVRYIKWVYTDRVNGNVALGNIYVDDEYLVRGNATVSEDLTLAACEIESEGKLTIESGATFEVTEPYALYNGGNSTNLVIKDGGQLKTPNAVYATVEKNIIGYTAANVNTNKGYYLISAPAEKYLYVAQDNEDVDAYHFDASYEGEEWRNFKGAQGAWNISASSAILYATKENSTLSLDGQGIVYNQPNPGANAVANKVPATTTNIDIEVRFNEGKAFQGWNLIGNPFTCTAYLVGHDFYRMNTAGDALIINTEEQGGGIAIDVCEGIFVQCTATGEVTFTTTEPNSSTGNNSMVNISVAQVVNSRDAQSSADYARIRINNGENLAKFVFNENTSRIYIPQGENDYAVVRSNGQGEMPVNFKAAENGTYTISIEAENIEMDYMHLIDNMTGADIDLLATPSYTFEARTSDYASRFRLVFSANNVATEGNDSFAFFNGSEWVVNASENATLQVMDLMGRIVVSSNGASNVSTNGLTAGVYMLRLIDGENVKTQKIVVR